MTGQSVSALPAVKALLSVAPSDVFVFERATADELLIVQDNKGVIFSCKMINTHRNDERWQLIEWAGGLPNEIAQAHVFLCRFEFLSWLADRFVDLRVSNG